MPADESRWMDQLNDDLDGLVGGGSASRGVADLDPGLAAAARRFHALDDGSAPTPELGARLWENLMTHAQPTLVSANGAVPALAAMPSLEAAVSDPPAGSRTTRRRRAWPVTELAAAAVVLFTLATGYVFYRETPSSDSEGPSRPAIGLGATPDDTASVVDFAECDVAPRVEPLLRLGGEDPAVPAVVPGSPDGVRDDQLPEGPAADAQTEAELVDALRNLTACRYYDRLSDPTGPNGRYFALLSDDYLRRALTAGTIPSDYYYWRPADGTPATVERTVVLPDGRVGALLRDHERALWGFGPETDFRFFVVFVESDGRWLVDEAYQLPDLDAATRAPDDLRTLDVPQTLELVLRDAPDTSITPGVFEDLATSGMPSFAGDLLSGQPRFPAGTDLTLVLRNVGTIPQRVEIPALDIAIEVAPLTTEEIVVNAPIGPYLVVAYIGGEEDALGGVSRFVMVDPNAPSPSNLG